MMPKINKISNFYLCLDIPDYSQLFSQLPSTPNNCKFILKILNHETNTSDYWYEQFFEEATVDTVKIALKLCFRCLK